MSAKRKFAQVFYFLFTGDATKTFQLISGGIIWNVLKHVSKIKKETTFGISWKSIF